MSACAWKLTRQTLRARRNRIVFSSLRSGIRALVIQTPRFSTSRLLWSVCAAVVPRKVRIKMLQGRTVSSIVLGRARQTGTACRPAFEALLWMARATTTSVAPLWTSRRITTSVVSLQISKPRLLVWAEQARSVALAWRLMVCETRVFNRKTRSSRATKARLLPWALQMARIILHCKQTISTDKATKEPRLQSEIWLAALLLHPSSKYPAALLSLHQDPTNSNATTPCQPPATAAQASQAAD